MLSREEERVGPLDQQQQVRTDEAEVGQVEEHQLALLEQVQCLGAGEVEFRRPAGPHRDQVDHAQGNEGHHSEDCGRGRRPRSRASPPPDPSLLSGSRATSICEYWRTSTRPCGLTMGTALHDHLGDNGVAVLSWPSASRSTLE